jgi:hypothetical protein
MRRYRLKLVLPPTKIRIFGISLDLSHVLKVAPNALTFVAYLTPEQAEYQLAAMWFLQAFNIGLQVEEA